MSLYPDELAALEALGERLNERLTRLLHHP
jgi:hypothetical protein